MSATPPWPAEAEGGVREMLARIADPRGRRGLRHPLVSILAMALGAMLCGAQSFEAIAQWAASLSEETRRRLGGRGRRAPSEPTFRRTLQRLDAGAFDREVGAWMAKPLSIRGEAVALDGKTLRGSREGEKPAVHLLSALLHREGLVVAQSRVAAETNELKTVKPLLQDVDLEGAVVTGDAIFVEKENAAYLVREKKADYVFTVKANQPTLLADVRDLGLEAFPPSARDGEQGSRPSGAAADLGE